MKLLKQQTLLIVVLILLVGCTQMIRPPLQDTSLEELLSIYQKRQEEIPPLKGLMKVTITDKIDQVFLAKWRSHKGAIEIDGFNLIGGTLFTLKLSGSEVSLVSSENNFQGNREAFAQYLMENDSEIRIEWVTLLDWLARGGLPDLSVLDRPALREEDGRLVLSFSNQEVWIDRKTLRVKEVMFHNADGNIGMQFDDYRKIQQTFFPFSIQINAGKRQMEIVFKELKVTPE